MLFNLSVDVLCSPMRNIVVLYVDEVRIELCRPKGESRFDLIKSITFGPSVAVSRMMVSVLVQSRSAQT